MDTVCCRYREGTHGRDLSPVELEEVLQDISRNYLIREYLPWRRGASSRIAVKYLVDGLLQNMPGTTAAHVDRKLDVRRALQEMEPRLAEALLLRDWMGICLAKDQRGRLHTADCRHDDAGQRPARLRWWLCCEGATNGFGDEEIAEALCTESDSVAPLLAEARRTLARLMNGTERKDTGA